MDATPARHPPSDVDRISRLISLPPAATACFHNAAGPRFDETFAASDPPNKQLGSGGGTAYLLSQACHSQGGRFTDWLSADRKLIVHGSGQSRRLPAYAAAGKPLIPIPPLHGDPTHRPDRLLLDLQFENYEALLRHAPPCYRVMVACGDAHIDNPHWLPRFPECDVLIFGLQASAEEASHHGTLICPAGDPMHLKQFRQKPSPDEICALTDTHAFYLDTGMWLLSARALDVLMRKCGWDASGETYTNDLPDFYDLYTTFGTALGTQPIGHDPDIAELSSAVIPLTEARFYHFGTNRSLLASTIQLRSPAYEQRSIGHASFEPPSAPVVMNACVPSELLEDTRYVWIENASLGTEWQLDERHVLTGIPPNSWRVTLAPGTCLDMAPISDGAWYLRGYGFDDAFRGPISDPGTTWFDRPAKQWFEQRGLDLAMCGIDPDADFTDAPLFPAVDPATIPEGFVDWLLAPEPSSSESFRAFWLQSRRLSARDILRDTDVGALADRRRKHIAAEWNHLSSDAWLTRCAHCDLAAVATLQTAGTITIPASALNGEREPSTAVMHEHMWRSRLAAAQDSDLAARFEQDAFADLRALIVRQMEKHPMVPHRNVLDDQIVWGRSPVRLDLAGGWTDTPPYCLEHGGSVVNIAVDLNDQPPVHVFARCCADPHIVLRSIDLGIDETVTTYEDLARYAQLGSGFAIARAALALAGFEPRFHGGASYPSLAAQLQDQMGGGIELSMVCAIPKGSGLGTSSILAATLLGTLSELCGLDWGTDTVYQRTMALEQLLTSGGGWQDQVGGMAPGLKLIETQPGLLQHMTIRGLPTALFSDDAFAPRILLYYSGITRVARDILGEIVRGLFLNSADHLAIIRDLGTNAHFAADAIQRGRWDDLCESIRRNWHLNRQLDSGTDPPSVHAVLDPVEHLLDACKLLGAGGGGYMLMFAKDDKAAREIRRTLTAAPPNDRARFVTPTVSHTGFQVTRS